MYMLKWKSVTFTGHLVLLDCQIKKFTTDLSCSSEINFYILFRTNLVLKKLNLKMYYKGLTEKNQRFRGNICISSIDEVTD
jgi:hypothetical protein